MENIDCPCNSGKTFDSCCSPYIYGTEHPPDPESLMRSRYTAFCRKDIDYLVNTFAPERKIGKDAEMQLRNDLARTMLQTRWIGLIVLDAGQEGSDQGFVEFAAFLRQQGAPGDTPGKQYGQLHERSTFVRRQGVWYYLDGKILPHISLGRNQVCFCGSGLKFKRCHGRD